MRRHRLALLLLVVGVALGCTPEPDPDVNDDGRVDALDASLVSSCQGTDPSDPTCAPADVNHDGSIDADDLALVVESFGAMECNGWEDLCDRPYDQVAYPTSHNAFSTVAEGFIASNQTDSMLQQLEDGVRGLMLDAWYYTSGPDVLFPGTWLCHQFCGLGARPLSEGLAEIRQFLEDHPYEIVTIIFENYVTDADMQQAFVDAGILPPGGDPAGTLLYVHPSAVSGTPWPTLRTMIEAGTRLVVLSDTGGAFPWYHHVFQLSFETDFDNPTPADLDCDDNRGAPTADLFILNHFLSTPGMQPQLAELVNPNPFFYEKALECRAFQGRIPNFVTVDHHHIGHLFEVVDSLNWLQGQTP